ncbi:TPA: glycosyltransferase family 2 protein, partial [Campylobacter jejuni]|nr:glycosyltransferase family 2 protein [Campylobacter jejuni]
MQQPLVSVIIPIYNVEKYLRECLDSVVNQTLREIEIILINDGSTDSCGKICDEYATKDKRIIVIHKE